MSRDEVLSLWRARPFKPFRIITEFDQPVDVVHPSLMIVAGNVISVGSPHPTEPPPSADDLIWLDFNDIRRVEPLEHVAQP
jgi:hypothetical protein